MAPHLAPDQTAMIAPDAAAFIAAAGWGAATVLPVSGDASFRRYFRLVCDGRTAILMDAPPATENAGAFVAVARYLSDRGISVPRILAEDVAAGLVLLEDFGDLMFVAALANGHDETELYAAATDVLALLHAVPMAGRLGKHEVKPYDTARMQREVNLVLDWYWPECTGAPADAALCRSYADAWDAVWPAAFAHADRLVQLDYHSPNLMWLHDRSGLARVGVLDFQDAMTGPAAYDLVSLLQDPRRDVAAGLEPLLIARYLGQRPDFDVAAFKASYAVMGAQRAARILGVFVRLWRRDGKPGYLQHLPRVWGLLDRNLTNPALAPVADWFQRYLPRDQRRAITP